jgi:NAD+ synthase (glutamine-hydrolysing)
VQSIRRIPFEFEVPKGEIALERTVERFPYVPNDPAVRDERCYEAYNIQVHGLMKRLTSTGIQHLVIGVSGGLDSTHALIVAARTMDRLGLPVYDVTFENVQAGERTSHLFRLANLHNGLVLGTGDLSELALGWATYGVGDHMSHYNVNASVPKTLIQHLIRWVIGTAQFDADTSATLQSILDTEISPELVPHSGDERDKPAQSTQAKIGPYELQDFNTYYVTRYGLRPSKIAFLSYHAWHDRTRGDWPEGLRTEQRNEYDLPTIKKWLDVFLFRFFKISQFKRSAVPNGPKVGSGGSLSPRGDWRAPSDSEAIVWLDELRRNVPD